MVGEMLPVPLSLTLPNTRSLYSPIEFALTDTTKKSLRKLSWPTNLTIASTPSKPRLVPVILVQYKKDA